MEIGADTLVCDLLTRYPAVFDVFERHGMCTDCRAAPPPVPLGHFVNKHCNGDLPGFVQELRRRILETEPNP